MKISDSRKLFTLAFAGLLLASSASADDFDFGTGDFSFDDSGAGSSSSAVDVSGSVSSSVRGYISPDNESVGDMEMDADADADLDLKYSGSNADAVVNLNLNGNILKDYPEDVVDEAYVSAYFGNFTLQTGKMKNVWGKGDKLHVIDNFNADDYTDFIVPDYIDRRIATPLVRGTYSFGDTSLKLDLIYSPCLATDRFATSGNWTPAAYTSIKNAVTAEATEQLGDLISARDQAQADFQPYYDAFKTAYAVYLENQSDSQKLAAMLTAKNNLASYSNALAAAEANYVTALNAASALSSDSSIIYPDTSVFKYNQAGARLTGSIGQFDLGASYYYGYYKQPSFNQDKLALFIQKDLAGSTITDDDYFLDYDRKQTLGLECSTIIWHFNVRGEACYNLTDDIDGTDPWVHNNSVQWLGGFDIDMPFWNMNVNIQETGTYILCSDKITGSANETKDVDYNKNGYSNNKIVANITTSFLNDKICPEVTALYGFENGDLAVMPKLNVSPVSGLTLSASGLYLWCRDDDSEFADWKNNNFVELCATVTF